MLYQAYQAHSDLMAPVKAYARMAVEMLNGHAGANILVRNMSAAYQMVDRAGLTHTRPPYRIKSVRVGNEEVEVVEEVALTMPFGTLLRFRKDVATPQPRVLVIAPMSGHFATLLRSTVITLLADHDVYLTDWHNARDVSLDNGAFSFDDYVAHVIRFLEHIGPGAHVVAVCQPCVQAMVAAAVMAEDDNPAQPASMTLMAGPIDTRIMPTKVNDLAKEKPISWFEKNLIARVPLRYKGARRRVYPGFIQLSAFMAMNLDRHIKAHVELFHHLAGGEVEKANATKAFYDEYFAVLDLPAEFYLETVQWVFQDHLLPLGTLQYRGRTVNPKAIRKTALLTVEGERDDICSVGQTMAAHDLASSLKPFRRKHHLQAGVGHYGVFSGRRWENQVYPIVRNVILQND
ncbi:poly(3-hydroxybutyrate) depolymerase [Rhodoblastus sphagnicola]|uniref:Poly(3-hydroxybutyrate) depolymerase n=1 Tax=Rhodoblastus sphagnicola TaxID=333368 RepID=A0A2S6N8A0_9HYPH|nr:polyhydroxyalkanoate depolymerase [Rhodoblastus sphagnicola]MBB4196758.1 polyhydroxyalkanoate depolymerase [Rhodoblastus sphagnicola]PPQ30827.1 poly(3-hydroxybutyrate) depolymerase [Rhodoblastus sphagnicola]